MSGKKSFLVYHDSPAFEMLDDSQLGRLLRMMHEYDAQGVEPPSVDDAALQAVWIVTRNQLKRDSERYRTRVEVTDRPRFAGRR